ncbi:hypothetical protein BDZ45DRAFT_684773 [Acephala macrosclerotiorum]|nr:hypothetical protein BDZ45DRAFT_684773 [Acephala macrosclerotiorum]
MFYDRATVLGVTLSGWSGQWQRSPPSLDAFCTGFLCVSPRPTTCHHRSQQKARRTARSRFVPVTTRAVAYRTIQRDGKVPKSPVRVELHAGAGRTVELRASELPLRGEWSGRGGAKELRPGREQGRLSAQRGFLSHGDAGLVRNCNPRNRGVNAPIALRSLDDDVLEHERRLACLDQSEVEAALRRQPDCPPLS